jgi:hypothetical protein
MRNIASKMQSTSAHQLGTITAATPNHNQRLRIPADKGCAIGGPSCLACELPVCVEEMSEAERRDTIRLRRLQKIRS